jgi:3-deoxy-manno-octulosonate cytidylyltransferase (CMP-KDO synthetase)
MKYAVVIPARYESSRFPGKPLVDICGKTMIQHVWERCCEAVPDSYVYVATDSEKIKSVVEGFGGQVVMTSNGCLTGTDRLAEANLKLDCDFMINVQGDEPLVESADIKAVIDYYRQVPSCVVNAMAKIDNENDFRSKSIPKVVASPSGRLLYMSRAGIPTNKEHNFKTAYKQVCIYAFSREHLVFFSSYQSKTPLELIEDIEILRFLENDVPVSMLEVSSSSVAVDFPSDVEKVEHLLNEKIK